MIKLLFKLAFFVVFIISAFNSYCQYTNFKFEYFSIPEGLSSSTCHEIFQDNEGFLWFGTIDGLNKFDGYSFEVYRPVLNDPNSISNNRINSIVQDGEGDLWIGTSNGLNVFKKQLNRFFRIKLFREARPYPIARDVINDLHYDSITNSIWIATRNGLSRVFLDNVDRSTYQNLSFQHYYHNESDIFSLDNNYVTNIVAGTDGKLWIGTYGEHLNLYIKDKDHFERLLIDIDDEYALGQLPKSIIVDSDGDFWIGNDLSKLVFWDRKHDTFEVKSITEHSTPIFHMYEDKRGLIWIATDGFGIYIVDKLNGSIQHIVHNSVDPFSLPNDQPSKILEDKDGIFWIATYNKGVSKLALFKSSFGHYFHQPGNHNSLSTYIAQSVLQDNLNNIWIGTDGGGLNLFNEQNKTFTHYRSDPNNPTTISSDKILYLAQANDNGIWVCTWDGGLNKFNPLTKNSKRYLHSELNPESIGQNTVWCAVEDNTNRLWLGTQTAGLNLLDPHSDVFYKYTHDPEDSSSLLSNFVFSVYIDSHNRLFVGTSLGLNFVQLDELSEFIPEEIHFKTIKVAMLQDYRINYIYEDHKNNIWVGSDLGLHQLSDDLTYIQSFSIKNGLPNNLILGITEDRGGFIWATTKSGLSRINPDTGELKNFNIQDGLQGMEFQSKSICKTRNGRILIGGINGFNLFNPSNITTDEATVVPVLTNFRLNNKIIYPGDTINNRVLLEAPLNRIKKLVLKYNQRYIGIEYVALHYQNPDRIKYSYKMIGLDDDYIEVGNTRIANYSNLPPGDYTFEVRSSLDADWEMASVASFDIKVLPPWWRTWWAYVIYFLVIIILLWIGMQYYTKLIREEKEHEIDQQKLQFFINVSHEFRTPLTLILNPINKMISSYHDPEEVKNSAFTIQRSAARLLNLVNQLLDFRKLELGKEELKLVKADMLSFSNDIYLVFKDLAKAKEVRFNFNSSQSKLPVVFDPDKYEKILTNLISNAIKYTDSGGEVTLTIEKTNQSKILNNKNAREAVEIRVSDTGVGFRKEQLQEVFTRFFNTESSKTGTGIGLNFTKALVELHGGNITVESEYQKGSTFIVHLPLQTKFRQSQIKKESEQGMSEYKPDLNVLKSVEYDLLIADNTFSENTVETFKTSDQEKSPVLLIVEDNKELRVHLKKELGQLFKVMEAVNGAEGLRLAKKHFPDIIISDVMMPGMDGFEMCRKIKSEIETCHIPIILMTARSLEEDRIEGYKMGADGYLPKPFNINVLVARLNNLLETKKRLREKFISLGGITPSSELTSNSLDESFLDNTTKIIVENISNPDFNLDELLKQIGTSRSQFYRKINSLTGQNPSHFIRTIRLKYASELLIRNQYTVKEIAYKSGFNSTAYFNKTFRELFGMTPNEYARSINYSS